MAAPEDEEHLDDSPARPYFELLASLDDLDVEPEIDADVTPEVDADGTREVDAEIDDGGRSDRRTIEVAGWGSAEAFVEDDLRVVEIDLAANVGARFLSPPVAPGFNAPTSTALGPGRAAEGLSLAVGGHRVDEHPGAALMWGTSRGPSHADFGEPCQDAAGSRRVGDDLVLLAVADGISQGRYSGDVATSAVSFGLDWLERAIVEGSTVDELDMGALIEALNDHLQEEAEEFGDERTVADATTVAFGAVDLGQRIARVCRVGDATVWALDASGGFRAVLSSSKEQSDGLVSGASLALPGTDPAWDAPDEAVDLADVRTLMVCSDGVGDELVSGGSRFARWLAEFMREPLDPLSLAYWLGVRIRGATDDRGAAVCWLPSPNDTNDNS